VPVLVAKEALPAGTKGEEAITKVEVKQIRSTERLPDALVSPSQLSSTRLVAAFAKGEQIYQGGLVPAVASIPVPAGKEAVPVEMPYVAGGAGYVGPGDYVNIYQVVPDVVTLTPQGVDLGVAPPTLPFDTPRTELLLTKVLVLDVNTVSAPLSSQQAASTTANASPQTQTRATGGSNVTVLLALDTVDVEKVIFGSKVQSLFLYLTKVDKDGAPAGPTPGQDYLTWLQEEANAAYARSNK
jgi:pilus assembly protein CpaB